MRQLLEEKARAQAWATDTRCNVGKLRAASAIFALLLGWLSAPVALATSSSVACSMVCCIEDGFCCCNTDQSSSDGLTPDDDTGIHAVGVSSRCPEGCANPSFTNPIQFRGGTGQTDHQIGPDSSDARASHQIIIARRSALSDSSPPRAPPALLS